FLRRRICNIIVEVLPKTITLFQAPPSSYCCTVFFSRAAPADLHRLLLMECWWWWEGPPHPSPASPVPALPSCFSSSWGTLFRSSSRCIFFPLLFAVCLLQRVAQVPV
ncbi:unnamed protein product, partial [Ectocarpus fasciculatus]